jgi:23S rRNA (uracil1939-C5)-methyltransferase
VVFVEGAAPSERVRARVTVDNRTFLRARVEVVLSPGPDRVDPGCVHAGVCGGCSLRHVAPSAQRASKQVALVEALTRIGRVDLREVDVRPPLGVEPGGHRTRARLAVGPRGELGHRVAGGRAVVDLAACPVLHPALERARAAARARLGPGPEAELLLVTDGARVAFALDPPRAGLEDLGAAGARDV